MKNDYTRIAIVLDRSGSMGMVREETISSLNQFIAGQREVPGSLDVKLVQFDDHIETVYDHPLAAVPEMTAETFVPRGMTALLDAQGYAITQMGEELARLPEAERPAKVIVLTITDGLENASKRFTSAQIAELIKQQREVYGWEFIYLGANQDAEQVAASMNIPAAGAITYDASPESMRSVMQSTRKLVTGLRSAPAGARLSFTAQDRRDAVESTPPPPKP